MTTYIIRVFADFSFELSATGQILQGRMEMIILLAIKIFAEIFVNVDLIGTPRNINVYKMCPHVLYFMYYVLLPTHNGIMDY